MSDFKTDLTWQQAVQKWKTKEPVWSAELGGIGPGYEQAIQELLFTILEDWDESSSLEPVGGKYPENYEAHVDATVRKLRHHGFSGAQVGVAKATAYQFLKYGYAHMMNKLPERRWILVSKMPEPLRPDEKAVK